MLLKRLIPVWQLAAPPDERIQSFYLIVCTLLLLWRAYRKTIFDCVPSQPTAAFN